MFFGVLGLKRDGVVMDLGRLGVLLSRLTVRLRGRRIGCLLSAKGLRALVRQLPGFALTCARLASARIGDLISIRERTVSGLILIVHTCSVPLAGGRNRSGEPATPPGGFTTVTAAASQQRIPILRGAPELTRHLTPDDRAELEHVSLPVLTIGPGRIELSPLLIEHQAFGATVLEGLVMSAQQIGEQTGIQLLGPGDIIVHGGDPLPTWLSEAEFRAPARLRIALFGNDLLTAAYRWPRLIQGLHACFGDQLQRLGAQLVICQLPRVDERVLAMMWLLAESWGQVTPGGVRLPLALTHETLGALVGARRPTVTLALRKLTRQGAILHQDTGWLLLEAPPSPAHGTAKVLPPESITASISRWTPPPPPPDPSLAYAELRDTIRRLREQHSHNRETVNEQLRRLRTARVRMQAVRQQISSDALSRREPPSS